MINEYIDIVKIIFIGFPSNLSPHTFTKFLNIKSERRRPVNKKLAEGSMGRGARDMGHSAKRRKQAEQAGLIL